MPRNLRAAVLLAGALMAALTLAACGGGKSASEHTSTAETSQAGTPTNPELQAIADKFASATFKANYTLSSASPDAQFANAQLVVEKRGKDRIRIDITADQGGQPLTIIAIETPDVSAFCLTDTGDLADLFGVAPGEGVCLKNDPSAEDPVGSVRRSLTDFEEAGVELLERSQRTVAGQATDCYRTRAADGVEETACFNADGVILYAETPGADGSTIEATSVSGAVNDADFALPYALKDLPAPDSPLPDSQDPGAGDSGQ